MGLLTAAISGAVGMALEVVAFRLYAPYFGYSIYVWGSMISVVMLALAVGYSLGGRLADRSASSFPLSCVILASALYQLVIVFTARPILSALSTWGDFSGTFTATLIIFAPPMGALACAGPFVIRLLSRKEGVGTTAGVVYSVSTAGSMLGVLGASFVLLPNFGTHATLQILCFLTAIAGVAGLAPGRPTNLTALIPFALLLAAPQATWSDNTVWTAESGYNLVRVTKKGDRMMLQLNTPDSVHTVRSESSAWTGFYYDDFALGPLLAPSRNVLVLGMGGGGSIHATRVTAPDANIDAVEIDSKVVEAAERFFDIRSGPSLRLHTADARPWLARSRGPYDLVHVDLYHGGPYIPFYLATVEFFELTRSRMSPQGLLMMNVFDESSQGEVLSSMIATMKQVFPSVLVLPTVFGRNHMIFAFAQKRSLDEVRSRLASSSLPVARQAAPSLTEPPTDPAATILTDDRAPLEQITRRMLLNESPTPRSARYASANR